MSRHHHLDGEWNSSAMTTDRDGVGVFLMDVEDFDNWTTTSPPNDCTAMYNVTMLPPQTTHQFYRVRRLASFSAHFV